MINNPTKSELHCSGVRWSRAIHHFSNLNYSNSIFQKNVTILYIQYINAGLFFPTGSLLGTDNRISDWCVPYDCWICLWYRELHGTQQLPQDYLWCALPVLCHDPLFHFCHHHLGRVPSHQAHSRCACEYSSRRSVQHLFYVYAAINICWFHLAQLISHTHMNKPTYIYNWFYGDRYWNRSTICQSCMLVSDIRHASMSSVGEGISARAGYSLDPAP